MEPVPLPPIFEEGKYGTNTGKVMQLSTLDGDKYSISTGRIRTFGTGDYVVLSLVFIASSFIGIYYAYTDRHHNTTADFMLGSKSMSVVPVALSLSVTFISALSLLGIPAEMYNFNTMFCYLVLGLLLAVAAAAHIFVPFFYRLKVTTVSQYLQQRYNTPVRVLATILMILQTALYFAFTLYAPALALNAVTNINLWGSVVATGVVVTFYTALGGMKAVLWADTLQAGVILAGLLAVFIQGCVVAGGFSKAWEIADQRGRIKFDDFSVDPSTRHSFWSVVIGGGVAWMTLYGINQAQVQRCFACPSVKKAQLALWLNYPCLFTLAMMTFLVGIVMFAFYADCHPQGIISSRDQMLPLFVMDVLADYDGIPGLFVACIFSGSLSSMSSSLNALSTLTIKDIMAPFFFAGISDSKWTIITKVSVVVYGILGIALTYVVSKLGRVLQAAYSVINIINGPLFGLFLLGMIFPWANSLGGFVGCVFSLVLMTWIRVGAYVYKVSTAELSPVVTTGCKWKNYTAAATLSNLTTMGGASAKHEDVPGYDLYTLSYLYYTVTGTFVAVVVGLIASFLPVCGGYTEPSSVDPRLICPLFDTLFPCLPERVLRPLRFGVDHTDKYLEPGEERKPMSKAKVEETEIYDTRGDPECPMSSGISALVTQKDSPIRTWYDQSTIIETEEKDDSSLPPTSVATTGPGSVAAASPVGNQPVGAEPEPDIVLPGTPLLDDDVVAKP